ncbi:MAG: prolipoprotein diacylglyceryl transferase [Oscillospiraceae bacterium]|nr:prolipoprotein diacylglyceryl transferase [Oscillospiraceae bacterium]
MDQVAFFTENGWIYWRPILLVLGALAAALMTLALCILRKRRIAALLLALPLAVVLSLFFARIIHWYCRYESYESLRAALQTLEGGGYSLIGAFLGVPLALGIARLCKLEDNLPALLDCAAPGAALGIAIGRLGDLFTYADRGKMFVTNPALQRLPYATTVVNATSGATEWRFATFFMQSLVGAVLFVLLMVMFLLRSKRRRDGDVALIFLTLYSISQVVLDSTRYDALFLRSNGFVSLEQILCAVVLVGAVILLSVRSIRNDGFRVFHIVMWVAALAGLGGAGYMEYYVQRHGDAYMLAYKLMTAALLLCLLAILLLLLVRKRRRGRRIAPSH